MHVALAQEGVVHGEGSSKLMMGMAATFLGILQVILEHGTIVGVCNLDEFLSLLHVALMAKVGHAILRDDCIYIMVRVVDVAGEWHDAGNSTTLGCGAASEDGQVGVRSEVGRTADAVHHLRAADLGAVHVTVEVALDGRVKRTDAETGDDFGAVAYL